MILLKDNLLKREQTLNNIIERKKDSLAAAPEGQLWISQSNKCAQYYKKEKKSKKKYIKEADRGIAITLAQKDYDQKVLVRAMAELNALGKMIKIYEKGTAEDIYQKLHPARQGLVTPIMLPDEEFVRQWLSQDYEGLGFEESAPEFYDDSGLRVRSKSEIGISNKYDKLGIPKLFERPLFLKSHGWVYPDFTLLNVRLRKEFIHEHLGMLDDPGYLEDNMAKIHAYEKNGYFPGKNLILTFETKKNPFDTRVIEEIAKQFLL